ncbi:MAG: hypothetical protein Q4D74_10440 [Comamonadaceae bacterium]|nr:hypothetical protein [Comamonadaceae bacterium]
MPDHPRNGDSTPPPLTPLAPLPQGRLQGREAFRQAVRDALCHAASGATGWREIILSDASFADWPLGERSVAEALHAWARHGQRLTLLARRYDDVPRLHPRFVQWRRTWSHKVEARACPAADAGDLPSVLWAAPWALHRLNPLHSLCISGSEAERRALLREELDGWLARSTPGFAATTLGL